MATPEGKDPEGAAPADRAAPAGGTELVPAGSREPNLSRRAAGPPGAPAPAAGIATVGAGAGIAASIAASAPSGLFGVFNELLTRPLALVQRARAGGRLGAGRLFAGAFACYVLYGVAAGCFAGGGAVLLAAIKVPLVIALTFLLCLPSLYVFGAMAGVEWSPRRLLAVSAGFAGTLGLLLVGLMPVAWLFSVSSRYLATTVWLHILLWLLTVAFGWRFLRLALRETGARGVMLPWLLLFCIVSFQVATFLRPVLARDPGEAFFASGKLSMFENLGRVFERDQAQHEAHRPAAPAR